MKKISEMNIRLRLTLWTTVLTGLILLLFIAISLGYFLHGVREEFDRNLFEQYAFIERHIEKTNKNEYSLRSSSTSPTTHLLLEDQPRWVEIWSGDDETLLYKDGPNHNFSLGPLPKRELLTNEKVISSIKIHPHHRFRVMSGTYDVLGEKIIIRVALNESRVWGEMKELIWIFGCAFPLALIFLGCAGYFLVRKTLYPVHLITQQAQTISSRNLKERLAVIHPSDELGHLTIVLNQLLDRLNHSFDQLKRFTSDAAHELRTPLTILRSIGEVAIQTPQNTEYYKNVIASGLEEVNHLTRLTDTLLHISRADAGTMILDKKELNLKNLVQETVELLGIIAEEKNQKIICEGPSELKIIWDPTLLKQVILNLVSNAIKYSPSNTHILIKYGREENTTPFLTISDQGPGIAPQHQAHIFDRFYRVDPSRTRSLGGTGLGLSIVKWAVETHGGIIDLISRPGKGATFRILFTRV